MVKSRHLIIVLTIFLVQMMIGSVIAENLSFSLDPEGVQIWINPNGSIDLLYNITLKQDAGSSDLHWLEIGQPARDFTIGQAVDQYGNVLPTSDTSSGQDYKVRVQLNSALAAGQTLGFSLITNVAHMIYNDSKMNPGNVGMQFVPAWLSMARVPDLRVKIFLPEGVDKSMVKTSVNWDNADVEGGRLYVYWERKDLAAGQHDYSFGVSFPKEYVQNYEPGPPGSGGSWDQYVAPVLFLAVFFVILFLGVVFVVKRRSYFMPSLTMESLGVRRGLTAVEASYLLDTKPPRIVTEILYSLLQKRAVWVESASPSVKLKIMEGFENKTGTHEVPLRYYEIDFLGAIKEDGTLDEEKLAKTVMSLRDTVEEKIRGYCRRDTVDYYRSVSAKAWEQVEQAGTPELASKAYDEQLLWLFLDPNVKARSETAFRTRPFEPSPLWLWYWYGYQHYSPHPTYTPNIQTPAQSAKPPAIPGADFANNIATAVENTSNNIVVNLERFANAIVPGPGKSSSQPVHHNADCVCACHACACACACVSCACACAGGGAG
jgi:hypothetical protein